MLDYTKAAIQQTITDFKKIDYVRNVVTQILYLAYLVYAIVSGCGVFIANLILLLLGVGYFGFFLYVTTRTPEKKVNKRVTTVFTRCKQVIKLFTLGVMLYGIYATTKHVSPLSVILSALMIVAWVLQILFEVVFKFFISRAHLIIEGMEADYEKITKPARTVGNFFKKITGQEVPEEKPMSKNRQFLEERVTEIKRERAEKKQEEKTLKKQAKLSKKQEKQQEKLQRKAQKKGDTLSQELAPTDDENR